MSAFIENVLKGYIIGTNQFNFQDARVDILESAVNNQTNLFMRTYNNPKGVEIANNQLRTQYGWKDDDAVFEEVAGDYIFEPYEDNGDMVYTTNWDIDNRKISSDMSDWMIDGKECQLFIMGTAQTDKDTTADFEVDFTGRFANGTFQVWDDNENDYMDWGYRLDDSEGSQVVHLELNIETDSNTGDFEYVSLSMEFDERAEAPSINISKYAIYAIDAAVNPWPADLLDMDGIYDAIVNQLIADGYIQAQS